MRRATVVVAVAVALAATACSPPSLDVLPAPAPISGANYRIDAVFKDALNLTVGAKVKQDGVVIGDVTSISTRDYTAQVHMRISRKIALLAGTTAQVRFTSPLGEDYVALTPPTHPGTAALADGATLPMSDTSSAPSIEDTFAALSLLLNGGGLNQLSTIVAEVNTAVHGRTGAVRDTVNRLDQLVGSVDAHKNDIDRVLTALSKLSGELLAQRSTIDAALSTFPPAIQILAAQVSKLDALVTKIGALGERTTSVLDRGQAALMNDLDELRPSLDALVSVQGSFPSTMQSLIRFGQLIDRAAPGDYLNAVATINVLFGTEPAPLTAVPPSSSASSMQSLLSAGTR